MFSKHRLCTEKPVTLSEPCIQLIIQVYSSLYKYMFSKHRLCTEKPVTLSEPCIQLIKQVYVLKTQAWYWETSHSVWTMHTTHYTGICSQNTGYVLRNQSHCLNHAYSPLHRSEPCIQLIIKVYVLKTQAWYWETSHTVWIMHTAHYTGLNHAYSSL